MPDLDFDTIAGLIVSEMHKELEASDDLLAFISGPLQSIQARMIMLSNDLQELRESYPGIKRVDEAHKNLCDIGWDLNAGIVLQLTGLNLADYIEIPES